MNVLLLTIDAWRASHASFISVDDAGLQRTVARDVDLTPNLAAFAADGVAFSRAVAHAPATPYAFPSIFSSTLPLAHRGYERIDESRVLVTERLQDAGWTCVGIHANPWLKAKYGYDRGYVQYIDVGEFALPLLERGRELLHERFNRDDLVYRVAQTAYRQLRNPLRRLGTADDELSLANDYLTSASRDENVFVWAHLLTPHAPYEPPWRHQQRVGFDEPVSRPQRLVTRAQRNPESLGERERRTVRRLYAASVSHADEQVGDLLSDVDDDTLVVVTADHGEALFEHGRLGHEPALYDELLRVPLLIRPPGGNCGHYDQQVRHVDIAPTILDYANVSSPSSYRGHSLRPLIERPYNSSNVTGHDAVCVIAEVASTVDDPGRIDPDALQVAVRTPQRKLYYDGDETVGFDLVDDPSESKPIRELRTGAWSVLESALDRRLTHLERTLNRMNGREIDSETARRLRELGYLD